MAIRVGVVVVNRSTPVVLMSPLCLWPLDRIMSFPTGISGKWNSGEEFVIVYGPRDLGKLQT